MKKRNAIIIFSLIFIDQTTKIYFRDFPGKISIIKDWFYLVSAQNKGIAFSIEIPLFVIKAISILVISCLIYDLFQKNNQQGIIATGKSLIIGGAIGNLIDRVFYGYVTDFIAIPNFTIFNLADTFIFSGFILIILFLKKNDKN
jgi:signal peptidase II